MQRYFSQRRQAGYFELPDDDIYHKNGDAYEIRRSN